MSDLRHSLRSPGSRSGTPGADQDHRFCRLPSHASVQFADQHPDHHRQRAAAVVHDHSLGKIPADRRGMDRQGSQRVSCGECGACGRGVLALYPGQVHAVHLRVLSGAGALARQPAVHSVRTVAAAAADSAAAGQGPQRRAVLHRASDRRLLPAAWRRVERFRHQLDRGFPVGFLQQHQQCRKQACGSGRRQKQWSGRCWCCSVNLSR